MKKILFTLLLTLLTYLPAHAGLKAVTSSAIVDGNGNVNYSSLGNVILPSDRDPLPTDDTTQGYAIGDNWYNSTLGTTWQAQRVTANTATWLQIYLPNVPIGNALTVNPVIGWGVFLLNNAYAGNALQLTRTSDSATKNIGFVNGYIDLTTADSFCAGTTCYPTIYYDQFGSCNLTQSVGATAPLFLTTQLAGFMRGVSFQNYNASSSANAQYMVCSGFAGVATNNFDIFTIASPQGTAQTNGYWSMGTTSAATISLYSGNSGNAPWLLGQSTDGWSVTSNVFVPSGPMPTVIEGYSDPSSGKQVAANDTVYTTGSTGNSSNNPGFILGANTSSYSRSLTGTHLATVVYSASLSTANRVLFRQMAYAKTGVIPQLRKNYWKFGDSISVGYGGTGAAFSSVPNHGAIAISKYMRGFRYYDTGIIGITGLTVLSDLSTWFPSGIQGTINFCDEYLGTNDVSAGQTASQVYATKSSITSFLSSNGCTTTYSGTMLPRQGANETVRTAINALMYATTPTGAAGLVDFGGDATIGTTGANANAALFNSTDQVHPTILGQTYMASDELNVMQASPVTK